jgi:hypothetical protein
MAAPERRIGADAADAQPRLDGEAPTIARLQLVERLADAIGGLY